jgi:hypothetical protein
MPRILVVYGSTYGQAERVAHRIAAVLSGAGLGVDIHRADRLPDSLWLASYDAFVVAASVRMGHHQKYVRDFVRRNATLLNEVPSAFVGVWCRRWRPSASPVVHRHPAPRDGVAPDRHHILYRSGGVHAVRLVVPLVPEADQPPEGVADRYVARLGLHRVGRGGPVRGGARGDVGAGTAERSGTRLLNRLIRRWREARVLPR